MKLRNMLPFEQKGTCTQKRKKKRNRNPKGKLKKKKKDDRHKSSSEKWNRSQWGHSSERGRLAPPMHGTMQKSPASRTPIPGGEVSYCWTRTRGIRLKTLKPPPSSKATLLEREEGECSIFAPLVISWLPSRRMLAGPRNEIRVLIIRGI